MQYIVNTSVSSLCILEKNANKNILCIKYGI